MGLDAYALKKGSLTVQIAGAFSYAGDDKNELKAVNLLMRIDDEAMQPSASHPMDSDKLRMLRGM